jgi:hypothetical protein
LNAIVEFLVANGARIDVVDAEGATPFDMAAARYAPVPLEPPPSAWPETLALLERLCAATEGCKVPALRVAATR